MLFCSSFFFQAEDGIRDLVRSRGLGDVYKRQEGALPGAVREPQHEKGDARQEEERPEDGRRAGDELSLIHI